MSVDSAENIVGWGQNSSSTNYDNGTNQWLVNNSSDKVCGSWAQAVSGDVSTNTTSNNLNSSIPNNQATKLTTSNQSDLIDETGSQTNLVSSQFNFDLNPNELYSTINDSWGKSVINHDNAWDSNDLSPSSANSMQAKNMANSASGFKSNLDQHIRNNGTELWENNLRHTKELQSACNNANIDNIQQNSNQQSIEQNVAETQWSKLAPQAHQSQPSGIHHFGGIWGEDEDLTNVWTGIPNSLTSQNSQMNTVNNTSSNNVFNRQTNSINCEKAGNIQLLSNKNWISDDNWGESIKTGNEWETSDTAMGNNSVMTPKSNADATENWNFYQANKLNSQQASQSSNQTTQNWSNDIENKAAIINTDADNGTYLWGNPQGQNKVLLWKDENNKQRNSQTTINNQNYLKIICQNSTNNGKGNWNELIESNVPSTSSNIPWNENQNSSDESDWAKNKRKLTKEIIVSSSPFRILVEMGFKELDVENSLRNTNLNLQESIEELRLNTLKETGVEIDRRKQQAQNSPIQIQGLPSVNNNIMRNNATKLPTQQSANNNLPSEKLLSHLVQQIQLAVQSGHLNAQILNQQLAPSTITLIYQLLQQIKIMQSLQGGASKNFLQNTFQCKQKIAALQKQISVQQSLLFKQQMLQQNSTTTDRPATTVNNLMMNSNINSNNNLNNNLGNLANDLSNLQLNQQNQSRLNQWKLPSNYDKDDIANYQDAAVLTPNDFSRAPGPSSKQAQQTQQTQFVSPNSWSNSMNAPANENWQNKNQLSSSAPQAQQLINPNNYNEMVGDFNNANKQWKETMQQMNNNSQALDQMYQWSNKLVDNNDNLANTSNNTFNTNTWTFSNSNAQLAAAASQNANIWTANNQSNQSTSANKPKGPPPGLGVCAPQQSQIQSKDPNQNSNFLLIRNLNLNIDESILKTLCRQHGMLLFFHMFLNHGLALVKYSCKEEAIKAQSALNNCPLGNITIQAQLANETQVQEYLVNCQIVNNNNNSSSASIYNTSGVMNDYMVANVNNAQLPTTAPNASSNMWSFNQPLWNLDQNSNSALQLLPDNLLEST